MCLKRRKKGKPLKPVPPSKSATTSTSAPTSAPPPPPPPPPPPLVPPKSHNDEDDDEYEKTDPDRIIAMWSRKPRTPCPRHDIDYDEPSHPKAAKLPNHSMKTAREKSEAFRNSDGPMMKERGGKSEEISPEVFENFAQVVSFNPVNVTQILAESVLPQNTTKAHNDIVDQNTLEFVDHVIEDIVFESLEDGDAFPEQAHARPAPRIIASEDKTLPSPPTSSRRQKASTAVAAAAARRSGYADLAAASTAGTTAATKSVKSAATPRHPSTSRPPVVAVSVSKGTRRRKAGAKPTLPPQPPSASTPAKTMRGAMSTTTAMVTAGPPSTNR